MRTGWSGERFDIENESAYREEPHAVVERSDDSFACRGDAVRGDVEGVAVVAGRALVERSELVVRVSRRDLVVPVVVVTVGAVVVAVAVLVIVNVSDKRNVNVRAQVVSRGLVPAVAVRECC